MSDRRILRTAIPVDDRWHQREMRGPIVHVDTRDPDVVEFWWLDDETNQTRQRSFRVFGTGHSLPPTAVHVGSVLTANGELVWHLMERRD